MVNIFTVISYVISFLTVTILAIYGFNLPVLITGQSELVQQYYYKNWKFYIPFDLILVAIYLIAGLYVSDKILGLKTSLQILGGIILTTILISGFFWLYFINQPMSDSFFSQWFYKAGFRAVLYDVVLISLIYICFSFISEKMV